MPLGLAALDALNAAFEELRSVLDGTDVAAIEAATRRIAAAASTVRAIGVWRSDEVVRERLKALQPLIESARVRTNLLADHANQRLTILAAQGAETAPLVYGR
ncbi:hypothetical protein VVT58_10690 [Sphingobium sp. SJ10-10]|uniref:hypothetical protein n=1 Tax=unclassified Sphingobium TaxID=2611147 RepID=UPI0007703F84|nr:MULTISPECIES: hypothetical protein [unclassified Sphingobium]AMK22015.1 hypothetical protein K426_05315 [Sphingobium sp. TKS]MEC6702250.1 hypothetical protein [Sphingobium sp. SJ10-10]NML88052.1 hypothetical protein [Sphingobium sp. TB-6]